MESDKSSCQKHNFPSLGEESPWWDESKKCVKEGPGRQVCHPGWERPLPPPAPHLGLIAPVTHGWENLPKKSKRADSKPSAAVPRGFVYVLRQTGDQATPLHTNTHPQSHVVIQHQQTFCPQHTVTQGNATGVWRTP